MLGALRLPALSRTIAVSNAITCLVSGTACRRIGTVTFQLNKQTIYIYIYIHTYKYEYIYIYIYIYIYSEVVMQFCVVSDRRHVTKYVMSRTRVSFLVLTKRRAVVSALVWEGGRRPPGGRVNVLACRSGCSHMPTP